MVDTIIYARKVNEKKYETNNIHETKVYAKKKRKKHTNAMEI